MDGRRNRIAKPAKSKTVQIRCSNRVYTFLLPFWSTRWNQCEKNPSCPNASVDEKKRTAAARTDFALFTFPPT
jgi:hypothetical protein